MAQQSLHILPSDPLMTLHLYPLNDTFVPKQLALGSENGRVKIGRSCGTAKTVPDARNGYFDSKVLSRQHAEVWEEAGKIYIKDTESINGTYVNGERLSELRAESEALELRPDDIIEFGINVFGEDKATIIHHKIVAKVLGPSVITNDLEGKAKL